VNGNDFYSQIIAGCHCQSSHSNCQHVCDLIKNIPVTTGNAVLWCVTLISRSQRSNKNAIGVWPLQCVSLLPVSFSVISTVLSKQETAKCNFYITRPTEVYTTTRINSWAAVDLKVAVRTGWTTVGNVMVQLLHGAVVIWTKHVHASTTTNSQLMTMTSMWHHQSSEGAVAAPIGCSFPTCNRVRLRSCPAVQQCRSASSACQKPHYRPWCHRRRHDQTPPVSLTAWMPSAQQPLLSGWSAPSPSASAALHNSAPYSHTLLANEGQLLY